MSRDLFNRRSGKRGFILFQAVYRLQLDGAGSNGLSRKMETLANNLFQLPQSHSKRAPTGKLKTAERDLKATSVLTRQRDTSAVKHMRKK